MGLRNMTNDEFIKRLLNCMFFNGFVSERGPAWRACDLFDDLHQNIGEQLRLEELDPSKVFRHIQSLAEEFYRNENFYVRTHHMFSQIVFFEEKCTSLIQLTVMSAFYNLF